MSNTRNPLPPIHELIELSESLIADFLQPDAAVDSDELSVRALEYLEKFEIWTNSLPAGEHGPVLPEIDDHEQRDEVRDAVQTLQQLHTQLLTSLAELRDDVATQLGALHKRGKALRTYVDRFPSRVTITGRRKG